MHSHLNSQVALVSAEDIAGLALNAVNFPSFASTMITASFCHIHTGSIERKTLPAVAVGTPAGSNLSLSLVSSL